jgi:hypothetical protein
MATYRRRLAMGSSPEQAADIARQTYLDYDIRAPWVNALRNTMVPFIAYTYRAVPVLAEAIAERPWKLAKYMAFFYAANTLAYALMDDDDEERERAAMRPNEQGRTWVGAQRMMRMPYNDDKKQPVYLDVRRWIPAGDVFDTTQGQGTIAIPAPLMFGGPLVIAMEVLAFNKQTFSGKPITKPSDTVDEKAGKVADYLWKAWLPSAPWIPGSWYWEKISNAVHGASEPDGDVYSVREAVLSAFGIKVKPLDVQQGIRFRVFDFEKEERSLQEDFRTNARQRQRNLITQAEFEKAQARVMAKLGNLAERRQAFAKRINPSK